MLQVFEVPEIDTVLIYADDSEDIGANAGLCDLMAEVLNGLLVAKTDKTCLTGSGSVLPTTSSLCILINTCHLLMCWLPTVTMKLGEHTNTFTFSNLQIRSSDSFKSC